MQIKQNMTFKYSLTKLFMLVCLLLIVFTSRGQGVTPPQNDRWMEIDLYWFERNDMENSVEQFWERYYPLVKEVDGWKGIILNVGWLSQYILGWNGDLDETIVLPKNMKTYSWFEDEGAFSGNTIERKQLWKNRFSSAIPSQTVSYDIWNYADLKKLTSLIKKIAYKKYKMNGVKVGTLVFGGQSIYHGDKMTFAKEHPNSFRNGQVNMIGKLSGDNRKYGAFPSGIPDQTPFTEFFGKQWGNLSKAIGLDAIVLRDGYLGVSMYQRSGPYGKNAPSDPETLRAWSEGTADLVKQTKISNPKALVIGYSNGASAVADWRVNCFDLETIAMSGYLDAWIDQTWAGAWNEIGQRPSIFWNRQELGWTYQLSFVLGHAAILANSKVRHYILTETYDAWESWDVMHNAKERLRWGIWAYSHAAVKKPDGLKMPVGNYISWCNKGKNLLSDEDVRFLAETSDAAFSDALQTKEVYGPTLVYCRSAMEWQSKNKPDVSIKEWIDEQAGSLMKWSVPILSITRSEYLPQVESDLFIFQTPVHLQQKEKENIMKLLKSGKPVAVFGSPAGGIDPDIMNVLGISTTQKQMAGMQNIGSINGQTDGIFKNMPNTFPLYQPFSKNKSNPEADVIYSVSGSPCLIFNQQNGNQLIYWDPPELACNVNIGRGLPLDKMLGSPTPYAITARLFNDVMRKNDLLNVDEIRQYSPVNYTYWQLNDGTSRVLAGNLEEGINHTADHSVKIVLNLPVTHSEPIEISELWNGRKTLIGDKKLQIDLGQGESKLFKF